MLHFQKGKQLRLSRVSTGSGLEVNPQKKAPEGSWGEEPLRRWRSLWWTALKFSASCCFP